MMQWRETLATVLRTTSETSTSLALLVLRFYIGGTLLVAHALPKLTELVGGGDDFVALVASLGLPAPAAFAWAAGLTQTVGSLLIILGGATRIAAVLVLSTLVIGVPAVHWGDPFGVVEAGLAYMAVLVAFTIAGAGRISLDAPLLSHMRPPGAAL